MCNNYNQIPRVGQQRGYNYCETILNRFVRDMYGGFGGKTTQRL